MAYDDCLIPLCIGVTGHRDIDPADPRLVACIQKVLEGLKKRLPHTPFVVMSPLAEGTDRLVARLAMEVLDARLIAPFPLPRAVYEEDFKSDKSKAEFADLLDRAFCWFELAPADGVFEGEARNRQYAAAGAYLVQYCQLLIAVWDGRPMRGAGGTAQVIEWKKSGKIPAEFAGFAREDYCAFERPDPGVILHIHPKTYEVHTLLDEHEPRSARSVLEMTEHFNRWIQGYVQKNGERALAVAGQALFTREDGEQKVELSRSLERMMAVYGAADQAALWFQKRENRILYFFFTIFVLAVVSLGLIDLSPRFVIAYLGFFFLAVVIIRLRQRLGVADRYLDYRGLAEGLRVLFFWRLAGIGERVSRNYLHRHRGVLTWIRQVIQNMELLQRQNEGRNTDRMATDLVRRLWVSGQAGFYTDRRKRLQRRQQRLDVISMISFMASLMFAVAFLVVDVAEIGFVPTEVVQALIGASAAIGAAVQAYKAKRAYDHLEKLYASNEQLFSQAQDMLSTPECHAAEVLVRLGKEALLENGEWLRMHREQPLEPPKG